MGARAVASWDEWDLNDDELAVLVGLLRLVVHADQQITAAEQDGLAALQRRFGPARWNDAVRLARDRFPATEALLAEVRTVRVERRRPTLTVLADLAGRGDTGPRELDILRQVAAAWALAPALPA